MTKSRDSRATKSPYDLLIPWQTIIFSTPPLLSSRGVGELARQAPVVCEDRESRRLSFLGLRMSL